MKGIGECVKSRRLERKLSQQALADLAGMNIETVNRIEHDQNCGIDSLYDIANALGLVLGDLLPGDQRTAAPPQPQIGICEAHRDLLQQLDVLLDNNPRWLATIESFVTAATLRNDGNPEHSEKKRRA